MAGLVFVDGQRVDKAGTKVKRDSDIIIKGKAIPYVSRGGLKLEKALKNMVQMFLTKCVWTLVPLQVDSQIACFKMEL